MRRLRHATNGQPVFLGLFVDTVDGHTAKTALSITAGDIKLWKSGTTAVVIKNSGGGIHIPFGMYYAVFDSVDTNTIGPMVIVVHHPDALPVQIECEVLPAAIYDAKENGTFGITTDLQSVLDAIEALQLDIDLQPVLDAIENLEVEAATLDSGGGTLRAMIGTSSLSSDDFLEIIQGESKVITFIVEAVGRFLKDNFDLITVKFADVAGTTVQKSEDDIDAPIERICEAGDVQVIRCHLAPEDTISLVEGMIKIEIAFDTQKARLSHSLKIVEDIEEVGS
jgi:hypothetical protein